MWTVRPEHMYETVMIILFCSYTHFEICHSILTQNIKEYHYPTCPKFSTGWGYFKTHDWALRHVCHIDKHIIWKFRPMENKCWPSCSRIFGSIQNNCQVSNEKHRYWQELPKSDTGKSRETIPSGLTFHNNVPQLTHAYSFFTKTNDPALHYALLVTFHYTFDKLLKYFITCFIFGKWNVNCKMRSTDRATNRVAKFTNGELKASWIQIC